MEISEFVKLVKELNSKTGAGMIECKKALQQSDYDIEKAQIWLKENPRKKYI